MNPFEERKKAIQDWKRYSSMVVKEEEKILGKATQLNHAGLRSKDALRLAYAVPARCKYFITTDEKIINKQNLITGISLIDPIGFIKEIYNDN